MTRFLFSVIGNASARTNYDLEECLKNMLAEYNDNKTALSTGTNLNSYKVEVHTIDQNSAKDIE